MFLVSFICYLLGLTGLGSSKHGATSDEGRRLDFVAPGTMSTGSWRGTEANSRSRRNPQKPAMKKEYAINPKTLLNPNHQIDRYLLGCCQEDAT